MYSCLCAFFQFLGRMMRYPRCSGYVNIQVKIQFKKDLHIHDCGYIQHKLPRRALLHIQTPNTNPTKTNHSRKRKPCYCKKCFEVNIRAVVARPTISFTVEVNKAKVYVAKIRIVCVELFDLIFIELLNFLALAKERVDISSVASSFSCSVLSVHLQ